MEDFDVYRCGTYQQVLGTGQVQKQMNRIHRQMESNFDRLHFRRVLEIGAGTGEHSRFVRSSFDQYLLTDIRVDLLRESFEAAERFSVEEQDVQNLTFPDDDFDRVILTCVLAHVSDPVRALKEVRRVSSDGAWVTIYVPCEPGLALRVARRLITIPKNLRAGVPDPYFYHFREHVHYYLALNHYIRKIFVDCEIRSRYYPLPFGTWNTNLYRIYQIRVSKIANA